MFGFGSKKVTSPIVVDVDTIELKKLNGSLTDIKNYVEFVEKKFETINYELKRLKLDHWDKEAFDKLIELTEV